MAEKVTCPYCGAGMVYAPCCEPKCYMCAECGSQSPEVYSFVGESNENAWKRANEAALRRAEPENRVLTQREVFNFFYEGEPCLCYLEERDRDIRWCVLDKGQCNTVEGGPLLDIYFYGKRWRCWLREPTEEERRNAAWEG